MGEYDDAEFFDGLPHRYELQDRYLELMRVELPAAGRQGGWVVTEDHCFMRIILDRLFNDCWYKHLGKRLRAYKQLNNRQLSACISMAESLLASGGEPSWLYGIVIVFVTATNSALTQQSDSRITYGKDQTHTHQIL